MGVDERVLQAIHQPASVFENNEMRPCKGSESLLEGLRVGGVIGREVPTHVGSEGLIVLTNLLESGDTGV